MLLIHSFDGFLLPVPDKGQKAPEEKSKTTEIPAIAHRADSNFEQTEEEHRREVDAFSAALGGKAKTHDHLSAPETAQKNETHKVPSSAIRQIDVGESKSGEGVGSAAVHVECATTVVYEGYLTKKGGRDVTIWKKKLEKALVCIAERFEAIVLR